MPRYLAIAPHLSVEDLERRYRASRDPVERSHWQIVWLVAAGHRVPAVAALTGYSVNWVRALVGRYNREGAAGLADRRHANPGQRPLLSPALRDELRRALGGPAPDGGLWTAPKVAAWLSVRGDRPIAPQRAWEAMRALGWTPQRPRPRATAADPAAQAAFKKGGSPPRLPR